MIEEPEKKELQQQKGTERYKKIQKIVETLENAIHKVTGKKIDMKRNK